MVTDMNNSFKIKNQISLFLSSFIMFLSIATAVKLLVISNPILALGFIAISCLCAIQAVENINHLIAKNLVENIGDQVQDCCNKIINNFKNNSDQSDVFNYEQNDLFIEKGIKYCINSVVQCFKGKEESKLF